MTFTVFIILVLNWWVALLWLEFEGWTFTVFFTIILWTTSMYVMAIALYPPRRSESMNYREIYEANRTWFLIAFIAMSLLDLAVTFMREQGLPDPVYIIYIGHYITLAAIALGIRKRSYDLVIAWYFPISVTLWSFGVRGTLG